MQTSMEMNVQMNMQKLHIPKKYQYDNDKECAFNHETAQVYMKTSQ